MLPLVAEMVAGTRAVLVSEKVAVIATPVAATVTLYDPVLLLAVKTEEVATPDALVTAVALVRPLEKMPLAPEPGGALKVTVTPKTGFPPESRTAATSGLAKLVLIVALWLAPLVAVMLAGAPEVFVSEKVAGATTPPTDAATLYNPAMLLAMTVGDVATPEPLVLTFAVVEPANVPLAPEDGAVKVTVTPETGFPPESSTVAANGLAKFVFTFAFWPPPPVAAILAAGPGIFVSEKLAGVATPATVAATLYDPAELFAAKVGEVATPEALVVALTDNEPAKAPLGPEDGAVKVTVTPETGFPPESSTVAVNGLANELLMATLWPLPPVAAMLAGG